VTEYTKEEGLQPLHTTRGGTKKDWLQATSPRSQISARIRSLLSHHAVSGRPSLRGREADQVPRHQGLRAHRPPRPEPKALHRVRRAEHRPQVRHGLQPLVAHLMASGGMIKRKEVRRKYHKKEVNETQ